MPRQEKARTHVGGLSLVLWSSEMNPGGVDRASAGDNGPGKPSPPAPWRKRVKPCINCSMLLIHAVVPDAHGTLPDIRAAMACHAGKFGSGWADIGAACPGSVPVLNHPATLGLDRADVLNGEKDMPADEVRPARIASLSDSILNIDELRVFLPDPCVYRMAETRLGLSGQRTVLASHDCRDAFGARAFMRQVNHAGQPPDCQPPECQPLECQPTDHAMPDGVTAPAASQGVPA